MKYIFFLFGLLFISGCSSNINIEEKKDKEQNTLYTIASFKSWLFESSIHNRYSPLELSGVMSDYYPSLIPYEIYGYYDKVSPLDINQFIESLPLNKISEICYDSPGEIYFFPGVRGDIRYNILGGWAPSDNPFIPCHFVATKELDLAVLMANIFVLYQLWITDEIDINRKNNKSNIVWRQKRYPSPDNDSETFLSLLNKNKYVEYYKYINYIMPLRKQKEIKIDQIQQLNKTCKNFYCIYKNEPFKEYGKYPLNCWRNSFSITHPNVFLNSISHRINNFRFFEDYMKSELYNNLNSTRLNKKAKSCEIHLYGAKHNFPLLKNKLDSQNDTSVILYEYLIAPNNMINLFENNKKDFNPRLIYKK